MKKVLIVIGVLVFALLLLTGKHLFKARSSTSPSAFPPSVQCTIEGRPCWEIVRLTFNETETLEPSEEIKRTTEKWWENIEYNNNSLKEIGLSVVRHDQYRDGGSESYMLSNGVHLYMNGEIDSPNRWQTTLTFPDGKQFIFDEQGNLILQTNVQ